MEHSSLREKAAQSALLAIRVQQLLQEAACRGSEACMQRHSLLLAQQSSLLVAMQAHVRELEEVKRATATVRQLQALGGASVGRPWEEHL